MEKLDDKSEFLTKILSFLSRSEQEQIEKVIISISPAANEWNKAAVCFVIDNLKLPSLRNEVNCFPTITLKSEEPETPTLTTNDWNSLALQRSAQHQQ